MTIRKVPIGDNWVCQINPNDNYHKNTEYPFVPMDAVQNDFAGISYFENRKIDGSGLVSFRSGDTLVAKITPCAENGKVAFVNSIPSSEDLAFGSTEFIVFRPNQDNVHPYFLYTLLSSHNIHGLAISVMEGTTGRQRIPAKAYKNRIYGFFPQLYEQKTIAGILIKVDEAIKAVENSINTAEYLKKALMQNLLTGKLKPDGTWRAEEEFYVDEKYGKVPKSWNYGTVGDISEVIAGQSPPGDTYNEEGKGMAMLNGPTEFTDYYPIPVQYTTKPVKICKVGDILFTVRGSSTGRMNFADREYCIGRGIAAIRAKEDSDNDFLYYTLVTISHKILAEAKGAGSTFPNVNRGELRKKKIIYPRTKNEQHLIGNIVKEIETTAQFKQTKIQNLQRLKKSLMQHLLTGKVRVDVDKINNILKEQEE